MDQENQAFDKIEFDNTALSELIKKTGQGDSTAFASLYDGTSRLVFGLMLRIIADQTAAEEALLDVYTRIWKESGSRDPENFMPLEWIITVARTCAIERMDETRQGRKRKLSDAEETDPKTTVAPVLQNHARTSLGALTESQKECLDWAFYTGLSCSEIAGRSGKPIGAVKTHTRIGMSKLYDLLRPLYEREAGPETAGGEQGHEKPTEEIRESAAFFSLGVMTQHEAASFEAHIREGCPVCEAEYYKFKHITAEIGLAVNETIPPDYIREMIQARTEHEPSEETQAEESEEEAAVESPEAFTTQPVLSQPPAKGRSILPWILVILFAITAAAALYAYYTERSIVDRLKTEMSDELAAKKDLQALLDDHKNNPGRLEEIISVVSKPETRIFHMAGLAPRPTASGAILWDVQQDKCLIFGYIPSAPEGKAYQLWYITPTNEKIPSGLLNPDRAGQLYDWFPIPEDISGLTMVITLEPEVGSKIPTLPYYAIGRCD